MFKNLFNFSYKRSFVEAIGLYIAYTVVAISISMLLAAVLGLATGNENSYEFGLRIGKIVAIVTTLSLSFVILRDKNLLGSFKYLILLLFSGLIAYAFGGMFGLIPVAFLSTRPKSGKK